MPFHALGARVRGLLAVLACLSSFPFAAHAQWWNTPMPDGSKWSNTPRAPAAYTREHSDNVASYTSAALQSGYFAKVERMHAEFLAAKIRTTDGTWLVEGIQEGIDRGFRGWNDAMVDKILADWAVAVPDSKLLPVVHAMKWQRRAWNARGSNTSARTPAEAQQLFREGLAKAAAALKESEAVGRDTPLWYWTALIVAGSSGASTEAFDALFAEAVARFPTYQTLYYTRVNYLLPQWGGDFKRVDAFVQQSVARTSATEGNAFYAWLYLDILQKVDGDYLAVTAATWPKMKQGFDDLLARYPGEWNKTLYATFACRARDRETTARLLGELSPSARLGAWSPGITTEGCRRFAFEKA